MIVTATAESEALIALEKSTGNEVWRQEAAGLNSVWGTPILVEVDSQRTDLVIAVPGEIWGLNPETGKLRWYCEALGTNSFCSSVVAKDGVVYAVETGPGGGGGIAVRVGGSGDVTESHIVWKGRQAGRIGTPLVHAGRVYAVSRGVANCFNAADGEQIFRGRLKAAAGGSNANAGARGGGRRGRGGRGGQDYSSPVLADGKIYFASRGGDIHVLEVGSDFKQLATNRVTDEREDFSATPAICDGELYIRSDKHLYCVAKLKDIEPPVSTQADVAEETTVAEGERRPGRRGFDPAAIFKRSDVNSDGKLSGDEITGPLKDNLANVDTDKDGAVTLEEFQSGIRQMMRRGRRGGRSNEGEDRPKRPQRPGADG